MSTTALPPRWGQRGGRKRALSWTVCRTLVAAKAPPSMIVARLRLMLPCEKCGARPHQPCVRGLGEVGGTHLQRGA